MNTPGSIIRKLLNKPAPPANTTLTIPTIDFHSGLAGGAWLLHGLVHALKPTVCVEIGSARGLSACYIGLALKSLNQGKLYAIDPHTQTSWNDQDSTDTFKILQNNLKAFGVQEQVIILREYSDQTAKTWKQPIDLLFIDGDHSYKGVKTDWELFAPLVKKFGIVVFHDTMWELQPDPAWQRSDMGVPRFVDELRADGYPVVTFEHFCGISIVQPHKNGVPLINPKSRS